nr:hypothetical protein [uncultured Gellertiella sp.]
MAKAILDYGQAMSLDLKTTALATLLLVAAALVLAAGFSGWVRHTTDIILALGQAGLSWCL